MRITAVHSAYSGHSVSGENLAVEAQVQALADAGHAIDLFVHRTDDLDTTIGYALSSAVRVAIGRDPARLPLPQAESGEHVLLLHNLFPNFGTRWISRWPGPVVTVLHNYRYLCANGLFLREGRVCTLCLGGSTLPALRHACYRESALATLPLAIGNRQPARRLPPLTSADVVVVQSERAHQAYLASGLADRRLQFVPGFGPDPIDSVAGAEREGWVFAGRLTPEKGLLPLLDAWPGGQRLDVIGDGPDLAQAQRISGPDVRFLGPRDRDDVLGRLSGYVGLVFPGLCWEGAHPMVVREALSRGTPVVAARGSAAADLVQSFGAGAVYDPGDRGSLDQTLGRVGSDPEAGQRARDVAQHVFSRRRWQDDMDDVLATAQERARTQRTS